MDDTEKEKNEKKLLPRWAWSLVAVVFIFVFISFSGNDFLIRFTSYFFILWCGYKIIKYIFKDVLEDIHRKTIPAQRTFTGIDAMPEQCTLADIDAMDGYEFEKHIKRVFENFRIFDTSYSVIRRSRGRYLL